MPVAAPAWAPILQGSGSLARALDELLWIIQVEYDHFGQDLVIRGYVKPDLSAVTEGQILQGFADSFQEVLEVLDQAGVDLARFDTHVDAMDKLEMQVTLTIRDIR